MTAFADLYLQAWPLLQSMFGRTVILIDADGTSTDVECVVNPRQDEAAQDATWDQRARQNELFVRLPDGYEACPGDSTAVIDGIEYTVLDYVPSTAGITKLLLERHDIETIGDRGRVR